MTFTEKLICVAKAVEKVDSVFCLYKIGKADVETDCSLAGIQFFINEQRKYAGTYYHYPTKNNAVIIFWVGYLREFGFCVSFWIENKKILENYLKSNNYTFIYEYSKIDSGYWIDVPFYFSCPCTGLKEFNKGESKKNDESDLLNELGYKPLFFSGLINFIKEILNAYGIKI